MAGTINYMVCVLVAGMLLVPGIVFSSERLAVKIVKGQYPVRSGDQL